MSEMEGSEEGPNQTRQSGDPDRDEESMTASPEPSNKGEDRDSISSGLKPTLLQQSEHLRLDHLEQQVHKLEEEKEDLTIHLAQLKSEHDSLQSNYSTMQSELASVQSSLANANRQQQRADENEQRLQKEIETLREKTSELEQANTELRRTTVSKELFESLGRRHKEFREAYLVLIERVKGHDSVDGPAAQRAKQATVPKETYDALCRRHADLREECRQLMQAQAKMSTSSGDESGKRSALMSVSSLMESETDGAPLASRTFSESEQAGSLEQTWERSESRAMSPQQSTVASTLSLASLSLAAPQQQAQMDQFDKGLDTACCEAAIKSLESRADDNDKLANTWVEATPLPRDVCSQCCAAVFNEHIYVAVMEKDERKVKKIRFYRTSVDLSDGMEWTALDNIPSPADAIHPLALIADNERKRLIVVTLQADVQPDCVWALNDAQNEWTVVAKTEYPVLRRDCSYKLYAKDYLVTTCGRQCSGNEHTREVAVFVLSRNEWKRWPSLRSCRLQSRMAIFGGSIVLVGGYDPTRNFMPVTKIRSLEARKAETATGKWRAHESGNSTYGTCGALSTPAHLVICGGLNPDQDPQSAVQVWSTSLKQWGELPPLSTPRAVPEVLKIGDELLVIGGCVGDRKYTNTIEKLVVVS